MYQIIYYKTERGVSPIDHFWGDLDKKARAKVEAFLFLLEKEGPHLKRPYADLVRGKIRELRIPYRSNQYRILYFFYHKGQIVLVHAFTKKNRQIRQKDIALARNRMKDWIRRHS